MFGKLRGSFAARKVGQKDTSSTVNVGKKSLSLKSIFSKKPKSKKSEVTTLESSVPVESTQGSEVEKSIHTPANMDATVVETVEGVDDTLHHPCILDVHSHAAYSPYPESISLVSSHIAVEPSTIIDDANALRHITNTGINSEINARGGSVINEITTYDPVHNPREAIQRPASPSNNLPRYLSKGGFCVKMSPENMKFVRLIGKGATGVIYLVKDAMTGTRIAVKVVEKSGQNDYKTSSQVFIMHKLALYPFFVDLYGSWSDTNNLYIAMAHYPTDLNAELMRLKKLEPARARFYMAEIIIALTTLHKCGIIHRNIKAANILIDWEGHIALCDFGLSKDFQHIPTIAERVYQPYWPYHRYDNLSSQTPENDPRELDFVAWDYRGSELEMAPEIHLRQPYSFGVDFWSAAVVLYWMLVGQPPWFLENCADRDLVVGVKPLAARIAEDDLVFNAEDNIDDTTQDFLQKMLTKNPKRRLMIDYDIPSHPYFTGVNWPLLEARMIHPPWRPTNNTYHTAHDDAGLRFPTPGDDDDNRESEIEQVSYNHPAAPSTSTKPTIDSMCGNDLAMTSSSHSSASTLNNPSSSADCSPSTPDKTDRKLDDSSESSPRPTTTNRSLLSKAKSWWTSKTWTPKVKGPRLRLKNLFRTKKS